VLTTHQRVRGTRAFQGARVALLDNQTRPSTLSLNALVHLFPPFMAHVNDNEVVCRWLTFFFFPSFLSSP